MSPIRTAALSAALAVSFLALPAPGEEPTENPLIDYPGFHMRVARAALLVGRRDRTARAVLDAPEDE